MNSAQREAVQAIEGPVLIVAGPGSGKTRVITHRVAYLVRTCGVSPYRILAVTFTNKAANEMKERLQQLLGTRAEGLTVGTFHAFCALLLRREGQHAGFDSGYTIYDEEDALALLKRAMEEAEVDHRRYPIRAVRERISRAKSLLHDPQAYAASADGYYEQIVSRVYQRYQERLRANRAVDFDDLLLLAVQLLQSNQEVREKYQKRYLHVMIDEFQDTNIAQYRLAQLLAGGYKNICVVGDPDQSIYSWRNADLRNILNFQRDFPDAKLVNLAENYRSTQPILEAAKSLISANTLRLEKELRSTRGPGAPIVVHEAYTADEEAQFVLSEVERLSKEGFKPGDCAAMYRVNAQSRALEEACLRYGVKYRLVGSVRFYQRREVKDVMAYLRLLRNPNDEVSFTRVVNVPPRSLGEKSVQQFARWARSHDWPVHDALVRLRDEAPPDHGLTSRALNTFTHFLGLLDGLAQEAAKLHVVEVIDRVLEATSYRQHLTSEPGGEERWENVMELRGMADGFQSLEPGEGLAALLERLALVADVDSYEAQADALTLITLHQAKGLEFPVVFIVGMEEGLLPHARSLDDKAELEEERRLCYVGITRARERLYLLRAFRRHLAGAGGPTIASRFLRELPSHILAAPKPEPSKANSAWGVWAPAEAPPPAKPQLTFKAGEKVTHAKFGEGIVVSCAPSGADLEVTVAFKGEAGVKRLLASFAPLQKVE
ncbi:MAG: UvrD-helicase domain-containing protein [Chloroflexota bacterium]|nr:UvrD-helicase domain-containing protein [Chloroflexota bacterium]